MCKIVFLKKRKSKAICRIPSVYSDQHRPPLQKVQISLTHSPKQSVPGLNEWSLYEYPSLSPNLPQSLKHVRQHPVRSVSRGSRKTSLSQTHKSNNPSRPRVQLQFTNIWENIPNILFSSPWSGHSRVMGQKCRYLTLRYSRPCCVL